MEHSLKDKYKKMMVNEPLCYIEYLFGTVQFSGRFSCNEMICKRGLFSCLLFSCLYF